MLRFVTVSGPEISGRYAVCTMANSCLQLSGFLISFLGWLGIVIAISTNDWVIMCKYSLNTCKKTDELETKGPWAECVISTGLYHCFSRSQILDLPGTVLCTSLHYRRCSYHNRYRAIYLQDAISTTSPDQGCVVLNLRRSVFWHWYHVCSTCASEAYIQTTRALMIAGSILGLPAVAMILMSMPCINFGNEPQGPKNKRTVLGGVLILVVGKRRPLYLMRSNAAVMN